MVRDEKGSELEGAAALTDGEIILRRWQPDDAPAVADACQDPLIARCIPTIPQPYTRATAEEFIAACRAAGDLQRGAAFAITDAETGALLGSITRHGPLPGSLHATFGYWLVPAARGRGIASRALRMLVDWTLATTDVIRMDLYTDPENDASQAVALRAGFEMEGIRRAWDQGRDGTPQDCVFYVRVRGDEPARDVW